MTKTDGAQNDAQKETKEDRDEKNEKEEEHTK